MMLSMKPLLAFVRRRREERVEINWDEIYARTPLGGKFEVNKSAKNDEYYWHLKSVNGKIIAQSEGYKTKQAALKGIKSVQKYAINAVVIG